MAVYELIAEKIRELGRADVNDLAPFFPDMGRKQIEKAMANAKWNGLIVCLQPAAPTRGRIGSTPGVYGPSPKDADPDGWPQPQAPDADPQWVRPVSSIWELGSRV